MDKVRVLLSPEQAAEFMGVTKATLAQWRHRKEGPNYIKMGNAVRSRIRYSEDDIKDYLNRHGRAVILNA